MSPHRKSKRSTPLRGSPIGRVILRGREHTDKIVTSDTSDFHDHETKCYCGIGFSEHTPEELSYIHEHKKCSRLARQG